MITIDIQRKTYTCPFCGHAQAFANSCVKNDTGFASYPKPVPTPDEILESKFWVYTLKCSNSGCHRISVVAINQKSFKQIDLIPQVVIRHYPDYIPEQIRRDYEEASLIIELSPKAAATLLRRCLQGMIRDFWEVPPQKLYEEISALEAKVSPSQWKALDGLRKLGNIGAHMEKDVNLIIDIDPGEAKKLLQLIELLLDKWYVARHEEEILCADITQIAGEKDLQRKNK